MAIHYPHTLKWRDNFHQQGLDAEERYKDEPLKLKLVRDSAWSMRDDLQAQMDRADDEAGRPRTPPLG